VFCFSGDLSRLLTAAARALAPGGLLAFTVDALESPTEEAEDAVSRRDTAQASAQVTGQGTAHKDKDKGGGVGGSDYDDEEEKEEGEEEDEDEEEEDEHGAAQLSSAATEWQQGKGVAASTSSDEGVDQGWRIEASGRYSHRRSHVEALCATRGLRLLVGERAVVRRKHADPDAATVDAHVLVFAFQSK